MNVEYGLFVWNYDKEIKNLEKHGIGFVDASKVFLDRDRLLLVDEKHSQIENRFYCIGKIGEEIVTVRFTLRGNQIRIIGAGFWRLGRKMYEEKK